LGIDEEEEDCEGDEADAVPEISGNPCTCTRSVVRNRKPNATTTNRCEDLMLMLMDFILFLLLLKSYRRQVVLTVYPITDRLQVVSIDVDVE
jgi:hypothetical protein